MYMSNMHRLHWIDMQIRRMQYPNCSSIAEQFSISTRQAARDIEYLRDSLNAPVEYDFRRKGYFYTDEAFVLVNTFVTEQERQGLFYLAEQYGKLESEHARHLSKLFRRLIELGGADEGEIALPLFPIDEQELSIFDAINRSIETYTKLDITFVDGNGINREIRLSPYKIYSYGSDNYVVGYCEPTRLIRFFALKRLIEARLTEDRFDLTPLLKQAEIVPELADEANMAYVRINKPSYVGTFPFRFTAVENGLYRVEYDDPNRFLAVLFASPVEVSIVSPKWLRNLYSNTLEKKLHFHIEDDTICRSAPDMIVVNGRGDYDGKVGRSQMGVVLEHATRLP
ncbi:WYL domain-containing protein [Paenibacillus ginsengarvi]|uniref:WYL domain-containing protein n=2 Tax=Paenibacillus ginsengarvi TaxID=400777 RepID=A0A3B0CRC0_9BACL|nr:WYL domain-containing protein [Paenibacillus ginsengarvi]